MSVRQAAVLLGVSVAALAVALTIWLLGILGHDYDEDS